MFEQPDRGAAALAGLGAAIVLEDDGPSRFRRVAERWRELCAEAVVDSPDGPPGAGLIAFGGFAFAPDGARAPHWRGFAAASLAVPEVAIARATTAAAERVVLTLTALACPDDLPEDLLERLCGRVEELRVRELPLLDPDPVGEFVLASAMPPEHYEQAVSQAVALASRGEAREDRARARGAGPGALRRMTRRPCSACCGRSSRPASPSASAAERPRWWPPARSCCCAARASA